MQIAKFNLLNIIKDFATKYKEYRSNSKGYKKLNNKVKVNTHHTAGIILTKIYQRQYSLNNNPPTTLKKIVAFSQKPGADCNQKG